MADEELRKILNGDDTPPADDPKDPPEDPKDPPEDPKDPPEDPEVKAKLEQKANLDKAIVEAQTTLKDIRKGIKKAKNGEDDDEELPKINLEDPSAKAWDKHIKEEVAPVHADLEKEKEEVRGFALKQFLKDKPFLSKNPEKLKEVMNAYEALSKGKISERTQEGILDYLDRAYGAVFHEDLAAAARGQRFERAQEDAIFSDIAVTRGATTHSNPPEPGPSLSDDDKSILAKWGMTPSEWMETKKKYG